MPLPGNQGTHCQGDAVQWLRPRVQHSGTLLFGSHCKHLPNATPWSARTKISYIEVHMCEGLLYFQMQFQLITLLKEL